MGSHGHSHGGLFGFFGGGSHGHSHGGAGHGEYEHVPGDEHEQDVDHGRESKVNERSGHSESTHSLRRGPSMGNDVDVDIVAVCVGVCASMKDVAI